MFPGGVAVKREYLDPPWRAEKQDLEAFLPMLTCILETMTYTPLPSEKVSSVSCIGIL